MALPTPADLDRLAAKLTPWENPQGFWFKREDKFAPLGYGGPNGSKLRQLIHLFARHKGNATHVVTGASIQSPQHSMTAFLAAVHGLPSLHVVGATTPETIMRHPNPLIAAGFGAAFDYIKVGYNPALQKRVAELKREMDAAFEVPYGITLATDLSSPEDLTAFHSVGAAQVANIPEEVTTLIVPAGSCNSLTSVLLGLTTHSNNVQKVVSIGIGPSKIGWVRDRLRKMNVDPDRLAFEWNHNISLHDSDYAKYGDRMPETFAGINFHPTYEGKMVRWMKEHDIFRANADCGYGFWIVGSDSNPEVCRPFFTN
jgi:1-aminocyclopropane-1-carboxylate deaminase/D-cysteine desulfhydrase-like pyridoxal-dependent ACC family enzyme